MASGESWRGEEGVGMVEAVSGARGEEMLVVIGVGLVESMVAEVVERCSVLKMKEEKMGESGDEQRECG